MPHQPKTLDSNPELQNPKPYSQTPRPESCNPTPKPLNCHPTVNPCAKPQLAPQSLNPEPTLAKPLNLATWLYFYLTYFSSRYSMRERQGTANGRGEQR